MDSVPSPFTRTGRTFWTIWTYITEVVGRYFRPEPTNIVNNEIRTEQEVTAARETDDNGGDEKNVIKLTEVSPESVSEGRQLRPVVAWEQCNFINGPGIGRENVQYTGTSSRGNDCETSQKGGELNQQIHKNTTQNDTNEKLNEGQEVQLELFTDIQILFKDPSSESSKIQAGNGQTVSYNSAEEKLSARTVVKRKQEEEECPVESTKKFHFGDDGNKPDKKDIRDEELNFGRESPNLTSVCVEPAKPLDKNDVNESKDREIIQDLQNTEDDTIGRFSEKDGEEETAVSFIDTKKARWKEEIVDFSEEEVNREDLCVTKYQISHGDGDVNIGGDIEKLWSMTEREAIQKIIIRDQEKDRDSGPSNDFNIFENKGERGDNSLRFHEEATENIDQVTDPKPQLLCGGFSDEERKLGKGQDIFAPESVLQLQMACDNKKGSVPNDEITVVRDEQRVECNIESSESTLFEERQDVPEDKKIKYGRNSEIEDNVVDTGTKKDTEEVKDKMTGSNTFCDQEKNVDVEKNKLEEINISKEEKGTCNEVGRTLISMDEVVRKNNTGEIRGGEISISLGLCEESVVAQEPKHVACEEISEEIPKYNNGKELKEDMVPEILEVGDDEQVNTTHLQEHIESDNKESVKNTGACLKSDSSPVSELMERKEETVEELFEVEEVENVSDTIMEDYTVKKAAKSLGETEGTVSQVLNEPENKILEDLVKNEAESYEQMDIEIGLLEEAAETDASLSDETLRMKTGLSRDTDVVKAQFGEGWMESKTVRTTFQYVKKTQVEMPEVKTELEPMEDSNETVAGSMRQSMEMDLEILKEKVEERIQKGVEVDTSVVRTEPELYTGLFMEFVSGNTMETQSGSVKEREAEIQGLRTNTVPSEKTVKTEANKLDRLMGRESVCLTQPMDFLSNDSLETINELSDKSSKTGTKLQGIVEDDLTDLMEKGLDLLEETISGQVVRSEDTAAELSEGEYHIKTIVIEDLKGPWAETEYGTTKETDRDKLSVKIETLALRGTQSGTVDTEADILWETTAESELAEELPETETGLHKDKEVKRQMIVAEPFMETDIKELVESEVEDSVDLDVGLVKTVALLPEEFRPKIDLSKETNETGYVSSAVTFQTEVSFSEEMDANLAETKYGSQDDLEKDILNGRRESVVSEETTEEKSGLSDSLPDESLESEAELQVKTNARLMEDLDEPETGLYTETDAAKSESSERRTSKFGLNPEDKITLQRLPDSVLPHGSTGTESRLSEKNKCDSSDESLGTKARSLKISEAGLFEKSVDCEVGLQKTDTEISDVEKDSGLSEETIDTGLAEKNDGTKLVKYTEDDIFEETLNSKAGLKEVYREIPDVEKEYGLPEETVDKSNVTDKELVKNTEAVLKIELEAEVSNKSTETGDRLVEKTEENTAKKLLEIHVGLSWETDEKEASVTEEVVETGPQKGLPEQTDFGSQVLLQEVEVGVPEKSEVGWLEKKVETDAGVPEENREDDAKAGTENIYQNITLQFDASALDFTAQKARIALKNPQARPPRDPRTLLNMPSLTPSPSKPVVHVPVRGPTGTPMGGIGIKLSGLGAGFPVLRKTEKGVRGEQNIPQKSEIEQVRDESSRKEETQNNQDERKTKWTPPRQPGFGNPLMMNELKNKLKKTTKEKGDD